MIPGTEVKDVTWLRPDGGEMTEADWQNGEARMLCLLLSGEAGLMHLTERGEQEADDTFLLILNAGHEAAVQRLPAGSDGIAWETLIDTASEAVDDLSEGLAPASELDMAPRSAKVLVQQAAA